MKSKIKRAWKITQVLTITGLLFSGAYVANEIAGTTNYYKDVLGFETAQASQVEVELTEEMVMQWLDQEAKKSDYVKDRLQIAEETFKSNYKNNVLENLKHKTSRSFEDLVNEAEVRARIITNQ